MAVAPTTLAEALRDRYTLEGELGRGGMAVVFLARDLRHDRQVALKVLHPELIPALGAARFQREIRVAARLQHPHILTVHDSGEAAGALWYTMPFVDGESLRARLRREGALPIAEALRIAREVGDALEYAHRHGVIHRDIKPENILLSGDHALVAEFGIARALGDTETTGEGASAGGLTQTGVAIGTPVYMSPEQAAGEGKLGAATDLYSLAVVSYEMLTGSPPFTGSTAQAIMAKRFLGQVPRLRGARPEVPGTVEAAILKALTPDAQGRFATVAEFTAALDQPTAAATIVSQRAQRTRRPWSPTIRLVGVLSILLALGAALGFWLAGRRGEPAARQGQWRLAVLPFENIGRAEDEYFVDGIADALRGKLSAVPGLQVIASTSSDQYKGSGKTPREIGRELEVQYLLVGEVRWHKAAGANRVQVSPELILADSGTTRWQHPYDAPLEDVFEIQGEIASRVADALDLPVGTEVEQQLGERPTQNLAAYDAFLRGERLSSRVGVTDGGALRRAIAAYEEAVALDSGFALAWAQLSRAHSTLYVNGPREQQEAEVAGTTAARAITLAPELPQAHFAQALYLSAVRREHARALDEVNRARRRAPGDAELLSMAGLAEQQLGRWGDAVQHFRDAQALDPRSIATARRLARALLWLRRYPETRAACDRALRISSASPDVVDLKLAAFLAEGDLPGAREVIRTALKELERGPLVAHIASYFNLFWVLDEEQQRFLLRLSPRAFNDDRSWWALSLAQTHRLRGNAGLARAYGDSAMAPIEMAVAANPNDGVLRSNLALAHALAGRRPEARRQGELAVRLEPIATNGMTGPLVQHQVAVAYVILGDYDAALDRLEPLLRVPYYLSPAWLRIDPTLGALRGKARFERLAR
jgi:eukaryotic-like serine/threonine-protein kinase